MGGPTNETDGFWRRSRQGSRTTQVTYPRWSQDHAEIEEPNMSVFDAPYEPSPWEPIAQEVARYERTDGSEPSDLVGDSWIILWTLGARTGNVRKTPLVRVADGEGRYAVIGSMGGAPTHPQWVHNIRASPVVRLQDGGTLDEFTVREVDGDEKATWWSRAVAVWPDYDNYQASTERRIPLFVLEPVGA